MKLHHHPRSTRARGTAATLAAFVLSLLAAPVALGEPLEGDLVSSGTAATDGSRERPNELEQTVPDSSGAEQGTYGSRGEIPGTFIQQGPQPRYGGRGEIPEEFLNQHDEATQTSATQNAGMPRPQRHLEFLEGQQAGADTDGTSSYSDYLRSLQQKAAAASGGEPAAETSSDGSGQPWLVGAGVVAAITVASIVLAIVRSRRQKTVTPAQRERNQVNV